MEINNKTKNWNYHRFEMSVIYDWKYDLMAYMMNEQTAMHVCISDIFKSLQMDMLTMTLQSVQSHRGDTNKYNK